MPIERKPRFHGGWNGPPAAGSMPRDRVCNPASITAHARTEARCGDRFGDGRASVSASGSDSPPPSSHKRPDEGFRGSRGAFEGVAEGRGFRYLRVEFRPSTLPHSSVVEQLTVNQRVVGSNPTAAAMFLWVRFAPDMGGQAATAAGDTSDLPAYPDDISGTKSPGRTLPIEAQLHAPAMSSGTTSITWPNPTLRSRRRRVRSFRSACETKTGFPPNLNTADAIGVTDRVTVPTKQSIFRNIALSNLNCRRIEVARRRFESLSKLASYSCSAFVFADYASQGFTSA